MNISRDKDEQNHNDDDYSYNSIIIIVVVDDNDSNDIQSSVRSCWQLRFGIRKADLLLTHTLAVTLT
jgi:hypothetical protein